jgi:hypothetical protein
MTVHDVRPKFRRRLKELLAVVGGVLIIPFGHREGTANSR